MTSDVQTSAEFRETILILSETKLPAFLRMNPRQYFQLVGVFCDGFGVQKWHNPQNLNLNFHGDARNLIVYLTFFFIFYSLTRDCIFYLEYYIHGRK